MASVRANGITIEYEIGGSGPPLLLIMGLSGQLTDWPQGFVDGLEAHFRVIRFDNRDIGLSTSFDDVPAPSNADLFKASLRSSLAPPPYLLADMADDTAALLDALDIPQAHVVGMSMGAMIAQTLAIDHPDRVTSLCSIMSNTGALTSGRPTFKVLRAMAGEQAPSRAEAVERSIALFELIGGRDWDAAEHRERSDISVARAYNPAGVLRQSWAIAASPDRTEALARIPAPTLVVHGLDDTLVKPSGGIATAQAIPDARLLMYPRMGHDIPATRHEELIEAIADNSRRAVAQAEALAH